MPMKGVILAGGNGTRLHPLTKITNKHLLPLYNKPVIFHAVEKLVNAGIDRIMIVLSPQYLDDFVSVLGSGQDFKSKNGDHQIQIVYGIQNEPGGIAQGLCIARDFVANDSVTLHLGDNIIEDDITEHVRGFAGGAKVFLKEVHDPERFGVATLDAQKRVTEIIEKPKEPKTNLAVVGVYIYDNTVFSKMEGQPRSDRGEYEITWVNNRYIDEGTLDAGTVTGAWFDIGTFDSLLRASNYMQEKHLASSKNA
jgi:glucose-1-phosphate thymidylyltransferase